MDGLLFFIYVTKEVLTTNLATWDPCVEDQSVCLVSQFVEDQFVEVVPQVKLGVPFR
jgi:hypothetical protein